MVLTLLLILVIIKQAKKQREFIGLESSFGVCYDQPDTTYTLKMKNLGSLGVGAPIFYRDMEAGEVLDYELLPDGIGYITLHIFFKSPFDYYLKTNSTF